MNHSTGADIDMLVATFDTSFGWKEIISIGSAVIAIGAAFVAFRNYRLARSSAQSRIIVELNLVAFDSRGMASDGTGRLIYYWTLDMSNFGGRTGTLQGFRRGKLPYFVVAVRRGQFQERQVKWIVYIFDKPQFAAVTADPKLLDAMNPKVLDELSAMHMDIPPGTTRSLSFALAIDNPDMPVDQYFLSLKLAFNDGTDQDLTTALAVGGHAISSKKIS